MARPRLFSVLILLVGGLAMTLAASGVAARQATPESGDPFKVAWVYVGSINDGGWSEAHDQGRIAVEEAFPNVETAFQENVPDNPADSERVIRDFAEKGFDVIFTTSFGFMDATINVAEDYPETVFVHISGFKTAENVGTGFGKQAEPRYVAGMISGEMTDSDIIGYVAAFPIPEVIRGINAFTLGAQETNPDVTVRVVWTNTWFDPQKERAAAEALLDGGADVIAQHQDTPAPQQAAEARGALGIGNDLDMAPMAPGAVMTTPVWHWGVFYVDTVEQVMNGTWESSQYWGGWEDGIVGLAPFGPMLPDDVVAMAEAEAEKFMSGEKGLADVFAGPVLDQAGEVRVPEGETATDEAMLTMDWFVEGVEGEIPE